MYNWKIEKHGYANSRAKSQMTERETAYWAGAASVNERNAEAMTRRQIAAELSKPLPKVIDPATRVRVLTANFRHRERGGETYVPKVGDTITMTRTEALDAVALGRVAIL
jgi:hypothetical protein